MTPTSNRSARDRAEELLDYVAEMRDDEGSVVADALAGIGYAVLALADTRAPEPVQAPAVADCGVSWVGSDQ